MKQFLISVGIILSSFLGVSTSFPENNLVVFDPVLNIRNVCNTTEIYQTVPRIIPLFKSLKVDSSTPMCDFCKDIVIIIKQELLVYNRSIVDIEKLICLICKHFSYYKRNECYSIVTTLDAVKELILNGLNPQQVCEQIKFCDKNLK